jgi:hypothetical protein
VAESHRTEQALITAACAAFASAIAELVDRRRPHSMIGVRAKLRHGRVH